MGMFLRRGYAQRGTRASDLEIGQTIKLNVNGTPWDWLVVHQGLPSAIYDASCDGTWLLSKDIYEERQWHSSNVNDYANSTIQSYLNGNFLNLFDGNVKDAVKQVKIPYRAGSGYNKTVTSGANGLPVKVFLLSSTEVNIVNGYEPTNEGACLSYFSGTAQNGNDTKRVANYNGSATSWWLRSPQCSSSEGSTSVIVSNRNGNWYYSTCQNSRGVRPALILPSDFIVSKEMLAA